MKQTQTTHTPATELEVVVELESGMPMQAAELRIVQELLPELIKDALRQMDKE